MITYRLITARYPCPYLYTPSQSPIAGLNEFSRTGPCTDVEDLLGIFQRGEEVPASHGQPGQLVMYVHSLHLDLGPTAVSGLGFKDDGALGADLIVGPMVDCYFFLFHIEISRHHRRWMSLSLPIRKDNARAESGRGLTSFLQAMVSSAILRRVVQHTLRQRAGRQPGRTQTRLAVVVLGAGALQLLSGVLQALRDEQGGSTTQTLTHPPSRPRRNQRTARSRDRC